MLSFQALNSWASFRRLSSFISRIPNLIELIRISFCWSLANLVDSMWLLIAKSRLWLKLRQTNKAYRRRLFLYLNNKNFSLTNLYEFKWVWSLQIYNERLMSFCTSFTLKRQSLCAASTKLSEAVSFLFKAALNLLKDFCFSRLS